MENTSDKLKDYHHHFSSNGDYKYFDDFSPVLRNKSSTFFLEIFTNIDEDDGSKKYLEVLKKNYCFGTSFNTSTLDLSSKLMIDISFKYVNDLTEKCVATNISTLKSEYENIVRILNILTDILYTNDKVHREIDAVWMLFLHNLNPFIEQLINIENSEITSWKSKLEIETGIDKDDNLYPNYITNNWGWIDFHILSFVKSFFNVLEEILAVRERVVYNLMSYDDKEKFQSYSKNIAKNLRKYFSSISIQEVKELKPLENFIKDKYYKIIEKTQMYEQNSTEDKVEVFSLNNNPDLLNFDKELESQKDKVEWFEKLAITTPYSENESNSHKNLNFDFIDYFKGKSRNERESNFVFIADLLITNTFIVSDSHYSYGLLWLDDDKRFKGQRITAFIQTLILTTWIHKPDENVIEILEKFINCFGITSLKGISNRNFSFKNLEKIMPLYAVLFDFIPKYQGNF